MANGGSKGFGVLTKSNIKFMDCLVLFLIEKEFATIQEIYDEYMSKPKTYSGGRGINYNDEGRWDIIRPTKNQLAQLMILFPFTTNKKYLLCSFWKHKKTEKKCFWSLTDSFFDDLNGFKNKLAQNYNIKTSVKYHKDGGKEKYA